MFLAKGIKCHSEILMCSVIAALERAVEAAGMEPNLVLYLNSWYTPLCIHTCTHIHKHTQTLFQIYWTYWWKSGIFPLFTPWIEHNFRIMKYLTHGHAEIFRQSNGHNVKSYSAVSFIQIEGLVENLYNLLNSTSSSVESVFAWCKHT